MASKRSCVIGIDSSTQSTKALLCDCQTGDVVGEAKATHTGLPTQDPRDWWNALGQALHSLDLSDCEIRGLSVAGQQHGLVTLDANGEPVVPASLWNNTEAAPDAERLNAQFDFATEVGSRLVASFTIAKLAHLSRTNAADLERTN